ncbi:MAG: hypothetical protein B7Y39_09925 [Bdellovibrio sp. 28-41-41]|nr:MAG: hypothetical protein B7Y39_09925 [Bdellovibrio sp. 28-41-41]
MRTPSKKVILDSLEFAARWGFLTQELFFEFFCGMSRAQKYRYWTRLVEDGHFVQSKHNAYTLILSHKSRKAFGEKARPSRSHFYIEHDAIVARIYLSLAKTNLLVDSWLEDELMRSPIEAYSILGSQQIQRIPDLVFDLKVSDAKTVRCSLEIEKVTKSKSRYAKIALAYLDMAKISISLFGCSGRSTERAIRYAFSSREFVERKRIPGTFCYEGFNSELISPIRFANNEMTFQNFLSVVTGAAKGDRNEKSVSEYEPQKLEAA